MPKLLFFSLLVVYTLAATLQVGGSPTTAQSPKPLLVDAMVTIPVNNLNSNSQYIRSLVQLYVPGLKRWNLYEILKLYTQTGIVYYLYRYSTVDSAKMTLKKDILILEYQNGTYVVMDQSKVLGQTVKTQTRVADAKSGSSDMGQSSSNTGGANANNGPISSHQTAPNSVQANNQGSPSVEVGGFSPSNANSLDPIQVQAKNFILKNVPKLQSWNLINVRMQIVSGQNNCFTFQNPVDKVQEEYCVWSQPWNNNFMQLTLLDGKTITSGGNP